VLEFTLETVGAVVSITIALLAARDPDALGLGKVKVALTLEASLIVPPFKANELALT
jgi:hypothetical protein